MKLGSKGQYVEMSLDLKVVIVGADLMSGGKVFHRRGAATANAFDMVIVRMMLMARDVETLLVIL